MSQPLRLVIALALTQTPIPHLDLLTIWVTTPALKANLKVPLGPAMCLRSLPPTLLLSTPALLPARRFTVSLLALVRSGRFSLKVYAIFVLTGEQYRRMPTYS